MTSQPRRVAALVPVAGGNREHGDLSVIDGRHGSQDQPLTSTNSRSATQARACCHRVVGGSGQSHEEDGCLSTKSDRSRPRRNPPRGVERGVGEVRSATFISVSGSRPVTAAAIAT